jgi:hypothetical protein
VQASAPNLRSLNYFAVSVVTGTLGLLEQGLRKGVFTLEQIGYKGKTFICAPEGSTNRS